MALRVTDWEYYRKIDTSNAEDGYQVKLVIWEGNCGKDSTSTGNIDLDSYTNAGSDFRDIAFGTSDTATGSTELDYWIESTGTDESENVYAVVWVELNSTVASNNYFYIYYESDTATDYSNGENTFIFFDDFPGSSLDTDKWDEYGTGTVLVSGSVAHYYTQNGTTAKAGLESDDSYAVDGEYRICTKKKFETPSNSYGQAAFSIQTAGGAYVDYCQIMYRPTDKWQLRTGKDSGTPSLNQISSTSNNENYYYWEICVDSNYQSGAIYTDYIGGAELGSKQTDSVSYSDSLPIFVWVNTAYTAEVLDGWSDWVFIAKYDNTAPPTYSTFNAEQSTGGATTYTKNIVSSITLESSKTIGTVSSIVLAEPGETYTVSTVSSITLETSNSLEVTSSIVLQASVSTGVISSITLETSNTLATVQSITTITTSAKDSDTSITLKTLGNLVQTPSSISIYETYNITTPSSITLEATPQITVPSSVTLKTTVTIETPTSITLETSETLTTVSSITLETSNTLSTLSSISLYKSYTATTVSSITIQTTPTAITSSSITLQTSDNGTGTPSSIVLYESYTLDVTSSITLYTIPIKTTPSSITTKTLNNQVTSVSSITTIAPGQVTTPCSITLQETKTISTPSSITLAGTINITTQSSITIESTETITTISSISLVNTYTVETVSSIVLTFAQWRCCTSSNHVSDCNCDIIGYRVENALDNSNYWYGTNTHQHWFIVDLGQNYRIEKVKSWSNIDYDPTEVDIFISTDGATWGTAVKTNISTWQDTNDYVEITLDTTKVGRYIKVVVDATELGSNQSVTWGKSTGGAGSILCYYGQQVTTYTKNVSSSITLIGTKTTATPSSITLQKIGTGTYTNSSITLQITNELYIDSSIHLETSGQITIPSSITLQTTETIDTISSITLSGQNNVTTPTSISLYETYTTATPSSITIVNTYTLDTPGSITTKTLDTPITTISSISLYETYTVSTLSSITLETTIAPGVTTSIALEAEGTIATISSITLYDNAEIIVRCKGSVLDYTVDDYVTISDDEQLDINNEITLEIEINPDINNSIEKYLIFRDNYYKITLGDGTYSYPSFGVYVDGSWHTVSAGEDITLGAWSHLIGTYDKDTYTLSIYIDGVLKNIDVLSGLGSYEIGSE